MKATPPKEPERGEEELEVKVAEYKMVDETYLVDRGQVHCAASGGRAA
jgi:hypothetical protein